MLRWRKSSAPRPSPCALDRGRMSMSESCPRGVEPDRGGVPREARLALGSMTVQHATFRERVAATAAAGLRSIGYHHRHYRRDVRAGATDAELVSIAAAHDVAVVEVESVHGVLEDDPQGRT